MRKIILANLAIVVLMFFVGTSYSNNLLVGPGKTYTTIQAAIDASSPGDFILVYPGFYSETASNRSPVSIAGTYTFGLFITTTKAGITIEGVDALGNPITDYHNILATVETEATNDFGPDGVFMEGDNVTITGLKIYQDTALGTNKTVSIIGNNFTMKYCHIIDITANQPWGSLYIDDEMYNVGLNTSHIQSYDIEGNWFDNCSIDPNNGAGYTGPVSGRKILNNKIELGSWAGSSISFTGSGTGVPWFIHGVGGAIITGNSFYSNTQHIRARGTYDNSQFDWTSYFNNNTFDRSAIVGNNPPTDIQEYSYVGGYGTISHVRRIGGTISGEISHALSGQKVKIGQGIYEEQLEVTQPLTIQGSGVNTVVKSPTTLPLFFTTSADNHPIVYVHGATNVTIDNLTVNGFGRGNSNYRFYGIAYYNAGGTVSNCTITAIRETPINGDQHGVGLYCYDDATGISKTLNVTNNTINDCQKNATVFYGTDLIANVSNNTITGSGPVAFNAQNGIELYNVAAGTVNSNTVSGFSYTPGYWTAAGILVLYNGSSVNVNAANNTVSQCQTGIYYINASGTISNNNVNATTFGTGYDTLYGIVADPGNILKVNPKPFTNAKINNHNPGQTLTAYIVNLQNNTLSSNYGKPMTTGLTIYGSSEALTVNATQNNISGYGEGVWIGKDGASTVAATLNNNNISGNTVYGVYNTLSSSIDATNNWWGNISGPYHSTLNPSGTGNAVSDNVNFTPWVGQPESNTITNANLNNPVNFAQANASMTFTSLPPNTNAIVNVQRLSSPPAGVPTPPSGAGSVAPVYLNITSSGLTNNTFNVTVVMDVSTISGFSASTQVMFYSTLTNSWVGAGGTYNPTNQTYTFTTNHFTPFAFVNPTNPDGLHVSTDITHPSTTVKWYPNHNMNTTPLSNVNDWKYDTCKATMYIVPTGTTGIFATKLTINWDYTKASLAVTKGNYFGSSNIYETKDSSSHGRYDVHFASANLSNVVPDTTGGLYLVRLDFKINQPGYIPVSITGTDFRYYFNSGDSGIFVTTDPGAMMFYLGDFVSSSAQNIGDGKIDGANDLNVFSIAYWSTNGGSNYMKKYDIGPTQAYGSYWSMPNPDGVIDFEDLVIFAIGYGKYANGQLQQNPGQPKPLVFSTSSFSTGENGLLKLPVKVSGNVHDLRAYSMTLNCSDNLEYVGVEKLGEMTNGSNFLMGKETNGKVQIDGAMIGTDAITHEGAIANILFRLKNGQTGSASFETVKARNSSNNVILVNLENGAEIDLPKTFGLSQNYPNPFNPSTLIKYQVPNTAKVTISIYDVLGKLVTKLVDGEQQAGYYSIEWKAQNYASGIYFYRMTAGDFTSVKKMIFVK